MYLRTGNHCLRALHPVFRVGFGVFSWVRHHFCLPFPQGRDSMRRKIFTSFGMWKISGTLTCYLLRYRLFWEVIWVPYLIKIKKCKNVGQLNPTSKWKISPYVGVVSVMWVRMNVGVCDHSILTCFFLCVKDEKQWSWWHWTKLCHLRAISLFHWRYYHSS